MTKEPPINITFDRTLVDLPLYAISQTKLIGDAIRNSSKYGQIKSSIEHIGIIEPIVVFKPKGAKAKYILLDGHLRFSVLHELGIENTSCLVSLDDEAFTYNKHINRISPIQEHRMIIRAIERGVSEEKIANALNLDVKNIIKKQNLLRGLCPEVCETLKDKLVAAGVFPILRKMKPVRQIETVELMSSIGEYTVQYARMLLAATPQNELCRPNKPKNIAGLSSEQMARMETEMKKLQREFDLIKGSYGTDVLNHTLAKGYINSLLNSASIVKYLAQHQAEMLSQFQNLTQPSQS